MALNFKQSTNPPVAILLTALIIASYQLIGGGISFLFNIKSSGTFIVWATSFSQLAFIVAPVFLILKLQKKDLRSSLGFNTKFNYLILLLSLPALFGIQLVSSSMSFYLLNFLPPGIKVLFEIFKAEYDKIMMLLFADKGIILLARNVILICLVPAFSEEILFRGYLQRNLMNSFKPLWVILLTGLFFGLAHFNPVDLPGLVLIGSFLSYLVIKSNSIFPAIIFHFLNNFIATISLMNTDLTNINKSNHASDILQNLLYLASGVLLTAISFLLIQKFIHSPLARNSSAFTGNEQTKSLQ